MKSQKVTQFFSKEALERSMDLSPDQALEFLENFKKLHSETQPQPSKLISIKIPDSLLHSFKLLAKLKNKKYQTWIKELMAQEIRSYSNNQ